MTARRVAGLLAFASLLLATVAEAREPAYFVVSVAVTGPGSVTSVPPGISCPGKCSASFPQNTTVTLTGMPQTGATFFPGWDEACFANTRLSRQCVLGMDRDHHRSAAFRENHAGWSFPTATEPCTVRSVSVNAMWLELRCEEPIFRSHAAVAEIRNGNAVAVPIGYSYSQAHYPGRGSYNVIVQGRTAAPPLMLPMILAAKQSKAGLRVTFSLRPEDFLGASLGEQLPLLLSISY
jgi:hypothetical protein